MIKGYVFDMDGVIWDGDRRIPYSVEKINELIAAGKKVVFLSNNSLRSRGTYVKRLKDFGITTTKENVILSSYAAGRHIKEKNGPSKIYALGTDDLKKELKEAGHELVERGADFVVVGLDKGTNYEKMNAALQNLMAGAELIACAPDLTYLENGEIKIGSGVFAKALEFASGRKLTVIGKPNSVIMGIALKRMGLDPEECISIGDKLSTDIAGAKKVGMKTALVLTGETKLDDAKKSDIKPDYILNDLRELP